MKKWLAALLCGAMMVSSLALVACNNGTENETETQTETESQTQTDTQTESDTETETDAPGTLNGKTPAQVYAENMTACGEQGCTVSGVVDAKVTMNMGGMSNETTMQMTMEAKMNGSDLYTKMVSPDGMGGNVTTEQWYVGGYVYTEDYDENFELIKVKIPATAEEAEEYYDLSGTFIDLPAAWLDGVVFTEEGENYVFTLTADKAMIEAAVDELDLGDLVEEGMEVTSVTVTATVNAEGTLLTEVYGIVMSTDIEGMTMSMDMTATITYANIGSTVVEAPADADAYVESELPDFDWSDEDLDVSEW